MQVPEAYAFCEEVVRTRARNFHYGIRLLPGDKRRALSAVYAFARRVDDIGDGSESEPAAAAGMAGVAAAKARAAEAEVPDGGATRETRLAALEEARAELDDPGAHPHDPVLVALADAARRFPIPLTAFGELIDGCAADVRGTAYATPDELTGYCRQVAGSIGRLSLGVYGSEPGRGVEAAACADALGIALQLTNILRDVREDGLMGRVYLPAGDLVRHGCTLKIDERGRFVDEPEALAALIREQADRARDRYDRGLNLLPMLDRRSAACTAAMAGIYRRLLDRIAADPISALNIRMSLPAREKAVVALRALAGVGR